MSGPVEDAIKTVVPSFVRRRYAVKFVVSILFVILVISSVGVVGYTQALDSVRTDAEQSLRSDANLQANYINTWVGARKSNTLSLSKSDTVEQGEPSRINLFLDQRITNLGSRRSVVAVHALDIRGDDRRIIASTQNTLEGTRLTELDTPWADIDAYFRTGGISESAAADVVDENRVYTSNRTYSSPAMGGEVVSFGAVTLNEDRAIVLEADLGAVVGSEESARGQRSTLVNANGEIVQYSVNASRVFGDGPDPASPDDFARTEGITALPPSESEFAVTDETVLAASDVGGRTGWTIVTALPRNQAFATVQNTGRTIGLIIFAGLLSLGLVGLVLGRQTVTPVSQLRRKVERMERGDLDVDLETTREDEFGELYSGFGSMRDSLQERIREIQETNRQLELKATEYSQVMRACADGDLTRRMDTDADNEAMVEVAREFNGMVAELEATTERIKRFATAVTASSREVSASAEEVRAASRQVSDSVAEISEGADRQDENLTEIAREMESLSATIDEIAASSNEVAMVARETVETGQAGREAAQEAIEDMDRVTGETEAAVEQMEQLRHETEQIDELLEFVTDLARRTNMLALNANIEASRSMSADEDGFGVVASEIKQLSEESQEATGDIADRLERIQTQTTEAVSVVGRTAEQLERSAGNVREAVRALEEVTEYAEATSDGVESISAANDEQVETTAEVTEQVEAVAEISTRTARESETVATLAEAQTGTTTEVSESADELSARADRLSETLDGFETDADVVGEFPIPADEVEPGVNRPGDGTGVDAGIDGRPTGSRGVDAGEADDTEGTGALEDDDRSSFSPTPDQDD
jgi:methyl-accepting chemotaxis protein